jgi:hypothetical protein
MEFNNLNELIINSLEEYDNNILKYNKYFSQEVIINHDIYEIKFIDSSNEDKFMDSTNTINTFEKNFEILGIFDNNNNIWIWGWVIYINNDLIKTTKGLLNYGLKLEPGLHSSVEFSFLKSLLVNSRILIESDVELNTHLSIIFYLMKENCLFIFPHKYYLDNEKYITYYYIVKEKSN